MRWHHLLVSCAVAVLTAPVMAAEKPPGMVSVNDAARTVTVTVEGSAQAQPDVMYVLLSVSSANAVPSVALARHEALVGRLTAALKALGEPLVDVRSGMSEGWEVEKGVSLASDVLATLDVSTPERLGQAMAMAPRIMDAGAHCQGAPKLAIEEGG